MRTIALPELIGFLALSLCPAAFTAEMEGSRYECHMISRGDNQPDFEINDDLLKSLIVSLHQKVSPATFQKYYGCTEAKYKELLDLLVEKQFVRRQGDIFRPTCMVISEAEGKELFRYAEPTSSDIAAALIADLKSIKQQYTQAPLSKELDFEHAAFFVLSNVLLDNWQIGNVEAEFVKKDRPLRHGKRYYFSLGQNLNSARESFGLYGNAGFKEFSVYGNNRKFSRRQILETRLKDMAVLCEKDHEVFSAMAATFKPKLLDILEKYRSYGETAYRRTGYAEEISYEEFFMWWYHFIYTKATDTLAAGNHLTIPAEGNFFYRYVLSSQQ
jgi:hypothetical protein